MNYLVFISHGSVDTWVAERVRDSIVRCGAEAFLDEANIDIGANFEDEILRFINSADELVVLLTPWAIQRPWVVAEIAAAWGRRIPVIALLLGLTTADVQAMPNAPIPLKERNMIPLNDIDRYLEQLAKRVEKRVPPS